jgi:hypothetical protein
LRMLLTRCRKNGSSGVAARGATARIAVAPAIGARRARRPSGRLGMGDTLSALPQAQGVCLRFELRRLLKAAEFSWLSLLESGGL